MEFPPDMKSMLGDVIAALLRVCDIDSLRRFTPSIIALEKRLDSNEVRIGFLGQMKRGKSSLINSLLEDDVLPTGVLPLTSIITEIKRGDGPLVLIGYQSGRVEEASLSSIAEFITEKGNPGNRKGVAIVRITYPSAILDSRAIFVDTPGIGSTYAHNSSTTERYLDALDAAVVVLSVDPPMTKVESDFIRQIHSEVPVIFFVLNKVDLTTEDELASSISFLRSELNGRLEMPVKEIFPVSTMSPASELFQHLRASLKAFIELDHDRTLVSSVGADLMKLLRLAQFNLNLGVRASAETPQAIKLLRASFEHALAETERELYTVKTLLARDRVDIVSQLTADLAARVNASVAAMRDDLTRFRHSHDQLRGRSLATKLQDFMQDKIDSAYRDWRAAQDEKLAVQLRATSNQYLLLVNRALATLLKEVADLFGLPHESIAISCDFSMESHVTYKVDEVFYSLDRFLLLLPGPLQRFFVYRRAYRELKHQLDRNAGRIRFDYVERLDRTFDSFQASIETKTGEFTNVLADTLKCSDSSRVMEGRKDVLIELEQRLRSLLDAVRSDHTFAGDGVRR